MVNNTVNGKKIGSAAGLNDITVLNVMQAQREDKELTAKNATSRKVVEQLMHAGESVSIKAYPGGNPNKAKTTKKEIRNDDLTH